MQITDKKEIPRYQVFSSTDHPIGGETKLWRFLTFEKFVWLLEKSLLYHRRLDLLGDPFEGSVTKVYAQNRDAGKIQPHFSYPDLEPLIFKRLMFTSYVTCWHASPHESAAMWKLYATEHVGVAVVTTVSRMKNAVDLSSYHTGMLGPMEYLDFENDDGTLPFGKHARPGFLKRKSFEHEKEVRGMILLPEFPNDPNLLLSAKYIESLRESVSLGIAVKTDCKQLIQEIRTSPLATPEFKEVVQIIANRHGLDGAVHPSTLLGQPVY